MQQGGECDRQGNPLSPIMILPWIADGVENNGDKSSVNLTPGKNRIDS
ncbi:hypothetical protein Pla8534_54180 [Lignipirellula cremea]|uniref:Uncharacterized protein n=1 Tax=Lignipirellula cremea TaxID=2528010 RepID=A0A518E0F3_9BACT|nr:hypothetical protein Pla8534_54180 [Lignipirellula cremea]